VINDDGRYHRYQKNYRENGNGRRRTENCGSFHAVKHKPQLLMNVAHGTPVRYPFVMNRQQFLRAGALAALSVAVLPAMPARAIPIVGGSGLVPNAANLASYIRANYPGVLSIGGVRADPLPDHPSGRAIDIMVGGNTNLGNAIHADILSQSGNFGVSYTLWQVAAHYDHIHVTVN
jgi:hypothetical protein